MDVKDFIQVYDNFLQPKVISSLLKWLNTQDFQEATVVGGLRKDIRSAATKNIWRDPKSLTNTHWCNYLANKFTLLVRKYDQQNSYGSSCTLVNELQALKYEIGDYYVPHTDNATNFHRTLSVILILNDDYEGGSLVFKCTKKDNTILEVPRKSGRVILFPSNFLFPHAVQKITKGCRYSIVAWIK